ncbi:protein translocase subunit SecF, partial [Candidatus Photodesmus anomalopis]
MFQIMKLERKSIDFMRWIKVSSFFSISIIVISIFSILTRQLNLGLDFTGGTLVEVRFKNPVNLASVRSILNEKDFFNNNVIVQHLGSSHDIMIRFQSDHNQDLGIQVLNALKHGNDENVKIRRVEFIGPVVGNELKESGILAIIFSLICILLYVSIRFEWRLAIGAILALVHDLIITLGIFSIMQIEVDLTIIAALLTVIGYSLNDTVVIFDRIRENCNYKPNLTLSPDDIINNSITQTLNRTLITSGTTLFVVIALFTYGGTTFHGFAIALCLGIIIGTYSSIYIASSLALKLGITKKHFVN